MTIRRSPTPGARSCATETRALAEAAGCRPVSGCRCHLMRGAPRTAACHDEPRRATTSQPFANRPKRLAISWPIHLADSHIVRHCFREEGVPIREVLLSRLTIAPAVMTHQSRSANHSVSQLAIVIAFGLAIGGQPATAAILPIFNTGVDSSGVALQLQEAWICTGGTRGMIPSPPAAPRTLGWGGRCLRHQSPMATDPEAPTCPSALRNRFGVHRSAAADSIDPEPALDAPRGP